MTDQTFIIYFDGTELNDEALDRFFEAGCDDATFGVRSGRSFADFDREADTLGEAVASAIEDLISADPSLRIVGFDSAALVSQSTIAEHVGMTREGIRLIASGERGSGDFPAPVSFSGRAPLYSRGETHRWLFERGYECEREFDAESEIALESIWGLLRFSKLGRTWTDETRDEVERVAAALPERDFLQRVLAAIPASKSSGE